MTAQTQGPQDPQDPQDFAPAEAAYTLATVLDKAIGEFEAYYEGFKAGDDLPLREGFAGLRLLARADADLADDLLPKLRAAKSALVNYADLLEVTANYPYRLKADLAVSRLKATGRLEDADGNVVAGFDGEDLAALVRAAKANFPEVFAVAVPGPSAQETYFEALGYIEHLRERGEIGEEDFRKEYRRLRDELAAKTNGEPLESERVALRNYIANTLSGDEADAPVEGEPEADA